MFSVVIPLYNKEKYITKSLNSVIEQSFTEFEIIVVNDGSTDNSLEVVEQVSKSKNKQINIIDQPNQGVSAAIGGIPIS
jgi:glycosyltransferase involved in cell wall biosynthesis